MTKNIRESYDDFEFIDNWFEPRTLSNQDDFNKAILQAINNENHFEIDTTSLIRYSASNVFRGVLTERKKGNSQKNPICPICSSTKAKYICQVAYNRTYQCQEIQDNGEHCLYLFEIPLK